MIGRLSKFAKYLARPGLASISRARARLGREPVGLALVYHRVGGSGEDPAERMLAALGSRLFAAQVAHLDRRYRLVPASQLLDAARARRRGGRIPVAITFDDDLPSHLDEAAPILRARGAPATFFLNGASLEAPLAFWWERLQLALDRDLVSPGDVAAIVGPGAPADAAGARDLAPAIEALAPPERRRVGDALLERLGTDPPDAGLRRDQVRRLAAEFEVGFHTLEHHPLTGLDDEQLAVALSDGRDELAAASGSALRTIAYPHGRADGRVAAAARRMGFELGFTAAQRRLDTTTDPLLIGRIDPFPERGGRFARQIARAVRGLPS